MKPLTYRQLFEALSELPEESLEMPVVILQAGTSKLFSLWECSLLSELPMKAQNKLINQIRVDAPILWV